MTGLWKINSVENQLETFADMVLKYGKSLTSHDTFEELWQLSIVDSARGWSIIRKHYKMDMVVDVGSGAGFPAIVIAILEPDLKVLAVDKKEKAVWFMEMVKDRLKLNHFIPVHGDVRRVITQLPRNTIITSRAVAPIDRFLNLLPQNLHFDVFLWKGPRWKQELKKVKLWYPFFEGYYELEVNQQRRKRYIVGLRNNENNEKNEKKDNSS